MPQHAKKRRFSLQMALDVIRKADFLFMSALPPLPLTNPAALETREVWVALTEAHRHLAELKGLCESLPNRGILLDTLGIQEAKDSSEIENIITTHDELYAYQDDAGATAAAKEVRHYVAALRTGYEAVRSSGLIRLETVWPCRRSWSRTAPDCANCRAPS